MVSLLLHGLRTARSADSGLPKPELPLPASTRTSICSTDASFIGLAGLPALLYNDWDTASYQQEAERATSSETTSAGA